MISLFLYLCSTKVIFYSLNSSHKLTHDIQNLANDSTQVLVERYGEKGITYVPVAQEDIKIELRNDEEASILHLNTDVKFDINECHSEKCNITDQRLLLVSADYKQKAQNPDLFTEPDPSSALEIQKHTDWVGDKWRSKDDEGETD